MTANQPSARAPRRLTVSFIPQQWISDVAIPCSAHEPVDATDHMLSLGLPQIHALRDASDSSDDFVDPLDRAHYGPYAVHCVEAICEYFSVDRLTNITEEMLAAARRGEYLEEDRTHLLRSWLVICGEDRMSFICQAEDVEHAIEQCRNAYPDEDVITAMRIPSADDNIGPDERKAMLDAIAQALGIPVVELENMTTDCQQAA